MNFRILKFFDIFKRFFERLGINYSVMRSILYVKLLMDGRKIPTILANSKYNEKDNRNKFVRSLWVYTLMGLILIPFILMKMNYLFSMSIIFAIVMFFIMSSLISDFSSVLLDVRDRGIIGTRPVDPKTLRMAKTLHIFIYMLYITVALTGPALVVSFFAQGFLFFIMFLFAVILTDIFAIVLTSLVYLVVLRVFDGEKLKDIINYFQIILSIVIMAGYQLLNRLFYVMNLKIEFKPAWWQYFLPPIWFSAPFQLLKRGGLNTTYLIFTVMAVIVPVITIMLYIKLMPLLERYIQKLNNYHVSKNKSHERAVIAVSKIVCRDQEERIFYRFAINMMKNEREFKLKVYPTLGYSLIIPLIMILSIYGSNLKDHMSWKLFLFIYFCGLMLPNIVVMIRCSVSFKAAWLYKALPIKNYASIFKGTMKAYILRLFAPMFLVEAVIFTALLGFQILPHLMVVFINMMIYNILCFIVLNKTLPFSRSFDTIQQTETGRMMGLMFILGIIALSQLIFMNISYGVWINLLISLAANQLLWRYAAAVPARLSVSRN